jgi:predicted porin
MTPRRVHHVTQALLGICLAWFATLSSASEFAFSGFATAAAGKVISGSRSTPMLSYKCPCFVADYGQGSLYGPDLSIGQESKVGLQASYYFNPTLSATAQVVTRGVDGVKANLEWAYLSYEVTPSWTIDVGRKRLPLYAYSDVQDVGYAYNWVRPPTDIYGWEVVNYNGINATFRDNWSGWAVRTNMFYGREDSKNTPYARIYNSAPQDVTWKNILGGSMNLDHDWLGLRLTYIRSEVQQWDKAGGVRTVTTPSTLRNRDSENQTIYGFAVNVDYENWLVRSEYSVFDRSSYSYKSKAYMLGIGYLLGKFTPMVTISEYKERNEFNPTGAQHDRGSSLTLRYDINKTSAFKVQLDAFKDLSGASASFVGDSRLISVSYDIIF